MHLIFHQYLCHVCIFRPYWRCYFPNTQAIIYVVDSSDTDRLVTAKEEFHAILEVMLHCHEGLIYTKQSEILSLALFDRALTFLAIFFEEMKRLKTYQKWTEWLFMLSEYCIDYFVMNKLMRAICMILWNTFRGSE